MIDAGRSLFPCSIFPLWIFDEFAVDVIYSPRWLALSFSLVLFTFPNNLFFIRYFSCYWFGNLEYFVFHGLTCHVKGGGALSEGDQMRQSLPGTNKYVSRCARMLLERAGRSSKGHLPEYIHGLYLSMRGVVVPLCLYSTRTLRWDSPVKIVYYRCKLHSCDVTIRRSFKQKYFLKRHDVKRAPYETCVRRLPNWWQRLLPHEYFRAETFLSSPEIPECVIVLRKIYVARVRVPSHVSEPDVVTSIGKKKPCREREKRSTPKRRTKLNKLKAQSCRRFGYGELRCLPDDMLPS